MNMFYSDQPIRAEMDELWLTVKIKSNFQQFFVYWLKSTCNNKHVYFGGCEEGDIFECHQLENGVLQKVNELECTHEEADQQMQYQISQAMNNGLENVLSSSSDRCICWFDV